MNEMENLPTEKNRCINCMYLAYDASQPIHQFDQLTEVHTISRLAVLRDSYKPQDQFHNHLKCAKGLLTSNELRLNVRTSKCLDHGWKLYTQDMNPVRAYEIEASEKNQRMTIIGIVISAIILIVAIFTLIVTLVLKH